MMASDPSNQTEAASMSERESPHPKVVIKTISEPTSDDQELFLKVLENLKNAVSKEDTPAMAPCDTVTTDSCENQTQLLHATKCSELPAQAEISTRESQKNTASRSEIDEPGTTTVTVSDKTKSLILQKLAIASDKPSVSTSELYNIDNTREMLIARKVNAIEAAQSPRVGFVSNTVSVTSSPSADNVLLSVVGFDAANHAVVTEKNVVATLAVSKENRSVINTTADNNSRPPILVNGPSQKTSSVQLFPCNFCDYYSDNKSYLKQHVDIVHNTDRPFKCPYCDYAGKRSHALREHLIVHTDERPFQCKICNATFRKKGHLTNHVKLHNSKRLVKCPLCKALVYDIGENGLDAHLKNDHDTERLFGCDLCDHVAANEPDILKHLSQKHKSKLVTHKCDKCPFETANAVDFNVHSNAHEMADLHVEIDSKSATKIIGVATIPTDKHQPGLPNTTIKLTSMGNNPSTSDTSAKSIVNTPQSAIVNAPQSAVVKPVWIKCSVCGFVEQDSEAIKKHMLEHLKDQYGDEYIHQIKDDGAKQIPVPVSTDTVTISSTQAGQEKITPHCNKAPILVPVTNVDQLLPQHAGTIDMNSPILVPVTDPSLLKSLQNQTSVFAVNSSAGSESKPSTVTLGKQVVGQVTVAGHSAAQPVQKVTTRAKPALPASILNHPKVPVSLQSFQLEQLMKNPNVKVIPIASKAVAASLPMNSSQSPATTLAPQNTVIFTSSVPTERAVTVQSIPTLTQIPVPRSVSVNAAPKLPPEMITLNSGDDQNATAHLKVVNMSKEQKLDTLRENLANVKKLIQEQEKLSKQIGGAPIMKLDQRGIPEKINMNGIVYYIEPVGKKNTAITGNEGFTHDSNAGRFKCTLCGYTCEYQRTIKAHIWKHSGNKNVDYPMFQNGPLSVYEDESLPTVKQMPVNPLLAVDIAEEQHRFVAESTRNIAEPKRNIAESTRNVIAESTRNVQKVQSIPLSETPSTSNKVTLAVSNKGTPASTSNNPLPNFIVYEKSKISNVAPALANLIASRKNISGEESELVEAAAAADTVMSTEDIVQQQQSTVTAATGPLDQNKISNVAPALANLIVARTMVGMTEENSTKVASDREEDGDVSMDDCKLTIDESEIGSNVSIQAFDAMKLPVAQSVVVESVDSVNNQDSFTAMVLQHSPRVSTQSPDSGLSEIASTSKAIGYEPSASSEDDNQPPAYNTRKRALEQSNIQTVVDTIKRAKLDESQEDAVTLLSLLKKGPNFNPACPGMQQAPVPVALYSNMASGTQEEDSVLESDGSSGKPKSGISTSLLTVIEQLIEQLRERSSKSDTTVEEEPKPIPAPASKKPYRRRSRKSSIEDNTPASGIENVEEFVKGEEVKYRCKLCHYTNDSTLLLRQHMKLHKPKQEFECSLCDLIAESSEALQDHMIQHCKVRTYQCKLCSSTFNYKSQLRAHMRMHNDQDILMCDYCDFETRNTTAFKLHLKSHVTKPPYKCSACNGEFTTSQGLRAHKRDECTRGVEKNATSMYACDECDFMCVGRREMKNHQRTHMGKANISLTKRCPYCDYSDNTIEMIRKHISEAHGESKPLKCEMCGFVAVSIRSLKSHMKRHVNDQRFVAQPLEQYKCNLCGYVCHHLPSLKSHMWRHAADMHYSYEFTNDVINAAIDFDSLTEVTETTDAHVDSFTKLIYEKMTVKGLEHERETFEESAKACCWVTFRCCQCGFETINKAELNKHMTAHTDIIKMTLEVADETESAAQSQDESDVMSS